MRRTVVLAVASVNCTWVALPLAVCWHPQLAEEERARPSPPPIHLHSASLLKAKVIDALTSTLTGFIKLLFRAQWSQEGNRFAGNLYKSRWICEFEYWFFWFFFFRKRNLLSLHIFIWGKKERKRTKYQSVNSALKLTYTKQEKK